jgi:protein O-mannosyl-transferase
MAFHATNILLYALASVLVFMLARRVLPLWAAWLSAALFAVHPVHVEAVANVVGQSELLVAIAILSATILYLRDRAKGDLQLRTIIAIAVLYTLGCFSKEHAIVLPAILVAAELTIIDDARPLRDRVARLRPTYLLLTAIAVAFVGVRSLVLADHGIGGFQPFVPFATLHISAADRILTAFGVVPEWVRLLYWPARLSSEYGPPDIEIAQGLSVSQLPGVLLVLGILALGVLLRRRERTISFGIALACISLLPSSNFIVPAGIVLAERTLFLPSAGAMLIVGALAVIAIDKSRGRADERSLTAFGQLALSVLIVVGAAKSAKRSTVWRDNDTLFRRAVIDAPYSYRAHYMLGAWHFENKQRRDGEVEYRKALHLFPYDPFLSYNMAEQYRQFGLCSAALPLYRWTNSLDPNFPLGHTAFAMCLLDQGDFDEAKATALDAFHFGGDAKMLRRIVFVVDSVHSAARHGKVS